MAAQTDDYTRPPRDKAELLARIDREWQALQQAFAGLSEQQMSVPDAGGWSIKDNLAHLAAWERFMRLHYLGNTPPHEAMGIDQETFQTLDEEGTNAIIFQRNKGRSLTDVLEELSRTHAESLARLEAMSFEEMMKPRLPDDPQKSPVIGVIIGNTYEHYREHRITIEKLAAK
jgi:hypothetical protein